MKFLRAFIKNLAFALLLITLQASVVVATCLDDVVFKNDINTPHTHQANQNDAHEDHTDMKQCHINASDAFNGHVHFTLLEDGMSNFDLSDLVQPRWMESSIDDLSLLIKSLSLAPPVDPPRSV